jgi:hypothetical protein
MKELEKRLGNIEQRIEKFLSLQRDLENLTNRLKTENQELKKRGEALDQQLKKAEKDDKSVEYQVQTNNSQKNQSINKKIDELLSEVEQCIALLKR